MRDTVSMWGLAAAGLALLAGMGWASTWFLSDMRLGQRMDVRAETIDIPTDVTSLQRGQHLASAIARCDECHGSNMGGRIVSDDRALMRIAAPNLTRGRGGVGGSMSDADLARAIRHGVDARGRPLLLMPDSYYNFSDEDLGAIVAYIRSLPPLDSSLPPTEIRPLGRALFALGQLSLAPAATADRITPRLAAPRPGATPEYGKYLSDTAGCPSCHGPGLGGGPIPGAPPGTAPAANLTMTALGTWSEADFIRTMRTGTDPSGRRLAPEMPWPSYAQMTDDELRALWYFLQAIPTRATGSH
jgi:cytochrome c553